MALVHETGAGLSTAESYLSVARSIEVAILMGLQDTWAGLDISTKEPKLREATSFIDGRYRFRGSIKNSRQALAFPRIDLVDDQGREIASNVVPLAIEKACLLLANAGASERLEQERSGAPVIRRRTGPLEKEWGEGGQTNRRTWPELDTLLSGLYAGSGHSSTIRMVSLVR